MRTKSIYYELPYWEHLKNSHLLDPMHIFKNVSSSSWTHVSYKNRDKLSSKRDLISSNTKKKHRSRQEYRGEDGHSFSFKKDDVQWILKREYLNLAKEVIVGVKVPYLYGSSLQCCFTTYEKLSGLKSHDHLNLLRVCIMSKKMILLFFYVFYHTS